MEKGGEVIPHPFGLDFFSIVSLYQFRPTHTDKFCHFISLSDSLAYRENRQKGGLDKISLKAKDAMVRLHPAPKRASCQDRDWISCRCRYFTRTNFLPHNFQVFSLHPQPFGILPLTGGRLQIAFGRQNFKVCRMLDSKRHSNGRSPKVGAIKT
jgi:hypothetical protein